MGKEKSEIKAVVWDIGGVLLEDPKVGDFWKEIEGSKQLRKEFGSNKLSIEKFVLRGAKLLGMTEKNFLSSYKKAYFSIKPIKDSLKIYENMKTNRYILCDTNSLHMDFIKETFPKIFEISKRNYFSPELKMRKDSREIFEYVSKNLDFSPNQILFIDNKKEIVDLARDVGFRVIHYIDSIKLKKDLAKLGVK